MNECPYQAIAEWEDAVEQREHDDNQIQPATRKNLHGCDAQWKRNLSPQQQQQRQQHTKTQEREREKAWSKRVCHNFAYWGPHPFLQNLATYLPAYLHTCLLTYLLACLPTYSLWFVIITRSILVLPTYPIRGAVFLGFCGVAKVVIIHKKI